MRRKFIRNLKIRTKLGLLGGLSILGLVILGMESILTTKQINQASTDISQSWLPSVIIAEELNTAIADYRIKECYHVLAKDQEVMSMLESNLEEVRQEIDDGFAEYEDYITNEQDKEMMEQARELWNRYLEHSESLLKISRENDTKPARELIMGESQILFNKASGLFLDVVNFNKEGAEAASIHGDKLYVRLTNIKIATILLVSVLIVTLVVYIVRSIEKPVLDVVDGVRRVSNGDLEVKLNYQSDDEIGLLTDSVNALIQRLRMIIEDERRLFRDVGNGNFEVESGCQQAYRGDFAPILYAFTGLKRRLEQMTEREKRSEINDDGNMDVTDKKS